MLTRRWRSTRFSPRDRHNIYAQGTPIPWLSLLASTTRLGNGNPPNCVRISDFQGCWPCGRDRKYAQRQMTIGGSISTQVKTTMSLGWAPAASFSTLSTLLLLRRFFVGLIFKPSWSIIPFISKSPLFFFCRRKSLCECEGLFHFSTRLVERNVRGLLSDSSGFGCSRHRETEGLSMEFKTPDPQTCAPGAKCKITLLALCNLCPFLLVLRDKQDSCAGWSFPGPSAGGNPLLPPIPRYLFSEQLLRLHHMLPRRCMSLCVTCQYRILYVVLSS